MVGLPGLQLIIDRSTLGKHHGADTLLPEHFCQMLVTREEQNLLVVASLSRQFFDRRSSSLLVEVDQDIVQHDWQFDSQVREVFDHGKANCEEELLSSAAAQVFDPKGIAVRIVDAQSPFSHWGPDVVVPLAAESTQVLPGPSQDRRLMALLKLDPQPFQRIHRPRQREPFFGQRREFRQFVAHVQISVQLRFDHFQAIRFPA